MNNGEMLLLAARVRFWIKLVISCSAIVIALHFVLKFW